MGRSVEAERRRVRGSLTALEVKNLFGSFNPSSVTAALYCSTGPAPLSSYSLYLCLSFSHQSEASLSLPLSRASGGWEMVGLSVVLEGQRSGSSSVHSKKSPQVINKATMSMVINGAAPPSPTPTSSSSSSSSFCRRNSLPFSVFPAPAFLDQCFLCKNKLLPGKDIYMYK